MNKDNRLIRFDWAIKRLLRHKADHSVLNGFLTSLLGEEIRIVRFLESESNREKEDSKQNRVDILAENDKDEKILIEVQNEAEDAYFQRMLFGISRLISEYIKKGEDYGMVAKVYSINIVYFNLGEGTDYVYKGVTEFRGLHDGELLKLPRHMQAKFNVEHVHQLYPEYYILRVKDFDKYSKVPLDQWMYFLSTSTIPESADAPGLPEAQEQLRIDRMTLEEQNSYFNYLDNMNSLRHVVDDAIGAAKFYGQLEGLAKGRAEGIAEGKKEEKLEIARNLKSLHIPAPQIAQATGLSLAEIDDLS